jgi:Kazal-type serine protease inhibitor domain
MTNSTTYSVSIARGLQSLCMLMMGALVGCSAEAPSAPSTDGVVQDELSWSGFCGGKSGHQCSSDKVCVPLFSRGCPGPEHTGLCVRKPAHCPAVSDPVCGCDGKTYGNLCQAAAAGSAMVHHGACKPAPACGSGGSACPGAGTCTGGDDDDDGHQCTHHQSLFGHHDDDDGGKTCECKVTQQCKSGERFNDSPAVCACEPNGDPCASVSCKVGELCAVQSDGTAACMPDGCNHVSCKVGDICVVQSDGVGACFPDACQGVTCKVGETCSVQPDGTALCQ